VRVGNASTPSGTPEETHARLLRLHPRQPVAHPLHRRHQQHVRRVWQYREKRADSFTKRYNITLLVYCESFADPRSAIAREKHLKNWTRAKKIALIETLNPDWLDLSAEWYR
jgi:putative endonuclease